MQTQVTNFGYHYQNGIIAETLFRVYISYGQVYEKTTTWKTTDKRTDKGKL